MKFLHNDLAPEAIGPYSQGTSCQNMVFISGQLPIKNGQLIEDAGAATKTSLENIMHILSEANGSKESIVKVTVFVRDLNDFDAINEAYAAFFGNHKPARALVQVARLPKDAIIEIEAIAMVD